MGKTIKVRNRKAFTIMEMGLVILVGGVMLTGLYKMVQNFKEDSGYAQERAFNQTMRSGIQKSFIDIIEAFQVRASTFVDADDDWGWANAPLSSPYPVFNMQGGMPHIRYQLDNNAGVLTAVELARLQEMIVSNFQGACTREPLAQANGDINLFCPKLDTVNGLRYNVGANPMANTPHAVGTPLDPSVIPIVRVFFKREYPTNNIAPTIEEYTFSMDEPYNARRSNSIRKLNTIRTAMEAFYNRTMIREVANSFTGGGLNSMDDEFVPWGWKMFGDDTASVNDSICVKAGNACANLNTDNTWRNTLSGRGLYTNRVIVNLLGGDPSFSIDGFNNPVFVYPIMNQCPVATADLTVCPIAVPALPADDYINLGTPPYVSAIYTPSFSDKTVVAPDYGRIYVSY